MNHDEFYLDYFEKIQVKKVEHCNIMLNLFYFVIKLLFFDFLVNAFNVFYSLMVTAIPDNNIDQDKNYSKF